jgi:hypothetical protein
VSSRGITVIRPSSSDSSTGRAYGTLRRRRERTSENRDRNVAAVSAAGGNRIAYRPHGIGIRDDKDPKMFDVSTARARE